jgi:hypothetical protein
MSDAARGICPKSLKNVSEFCPKTVVRRDLRRSCCRQQEYFNLNNEYSGKKILEEFQSQFVLKRAIAGDPAEHSKFSAGNVHLSVS